MVLRLPPQHCEVNMKNNHTALKINYAPKLLIYGIEIVIPDMWKILSLTLPKKCCSVENNTDELFDQETSYFMQIT